MPESHLITLDGCTPTPLASYLKALGVLRLIATQESEARGHWRGNGFVLSTAMDRKAIEHFLLFDYTPTPIMAPWNGGSGFYEKDNKTALSSILESTDARFNSYRTCIGIAEHALTGLDRSASPKGDVKARLLTRMRASLPEDALTWLDAAVMISGDSPQYPPLLGTGGNDGRLDFTNNFMQRLLEVLISQQDEPNSPSRSWLQSALFAAPSAGLTKNSIGQFSPGQAGGPNAGTGFDADAAINPWDFVLMIEGALAFAAAAVRRNANDPAGVLSYPFTVRAVGAGAGNLGEGDTANARGELWMPLWSSAATYPEVQSLLAEGRVALGRRPARDALDFVRAAHGLGTYRGISAFQRYGLLMRSGKAYLATPLSRVEVSDNPETPWLADLDSFQWLDRFRQFARGDNTANRFRMLRKRLEDQLFALAGRKPTASDAQSLLILLGEIQSALASNQTVVRDATVNPIPRLAEIWVTAADDDSPAFRIAKALAGLRGIGEHPLPLRAQWFPVQRRMNKWMNADAGERFRIYTGTRGRLVESLVAVLERRLWLGGQMEMPDTPLDSPAGVTLGDVAAFLRDDSMDARIAALIPGLCLCSIPQDTDRSAGTGGVPAAFGLMKLTLTSNGLLRSLNHLGKQDRLPIPTGLVAQLAAGNHENRAVRIAWRRLHACGLEPGMPAESLPELGGISSQRSAAALLIPLRYGTTAALADTLLKHSGTEAA